LFTASAGQLLAQVVHRDGLGPLLGLHLLHGSGDDRADHVGAEHVLFKITEDGTLDDKA
jgi:hypothetical protein